MTSGKHWEFNNYTLPQESFSALCSVRKTVLYPYILDMKKANIVRLKSADQYIDQALLKWQKSGGIET